MCSGWPLKISGLPVIPVGQFGMWQLLHTMHPTRHHQPLAEAELVRPEQGVLDHVVPVLDAAADAELHARPQPVHDQRLVRLGQAHLARQPGVLLADDTIAAPVPPSMPSISMMSAPAFATPTAMVPMFSTATSLTDTGMPGFAAFRS